MSEAASTSTRNAAAASATSSRSALAGRPEQVEGDRVVHLHQVQQPDPVVDRRPPQLVRGVQLVLAAPGQVADERGPVVQPQPGERGIGHGRIAVPVTDRR